MATGLTTGGENWRDKHRCRLPSLSPFTFAGGATPPQPRQQEEQTKGPTQSINVIIRPWTIKSSLLKSRVFHNCFATLARHDQDSCHNYLHSTWGGWTCYGSLPLNELAQLLKCDGKQCLDITHAAATTDDGPGKERSEKLTDLRSTIKSTDKIRRYVIICNMRSRSKIAKL